MENYHLPKTQKILFNKGNDISIFKSILATLIVQIAINSLGQITQVKGQLQTVSLCIINNCAECSNPQFCTKCIPPYRLNSFGYCDAQEQCQIYEVYQPISQTCEQSCNTDQVQNDVLSLCEKAHSCSKTNNIGNKNLITEFNLPVFYEQDPQIYMQLSSIGMINIFDSSNLQFQAQIITDMKTISKSYYDSSSKELVVTNTLGEIEIWNILDASQVFKTRVANYENTNVFYFTDIKKFFYLNPTKFITVIDDFSKPPKVLPYQLVNNDFNILYVSQNNSIVFAGTSKELLHITADNNYSQLFYNKFDSTLSIKPLDLFRSTVMSKIIMLYKLSTPVSGTVLYYATTLQWIESADAIPAQIGVFLDTVYQKLNTTHLQFYQVDLQGKFNKNGPAYLVEPNYLIPYDKNTKVIALTTTSSAKVLGPHYRYNLDTTSTNIFTDKMLQNSTLFQIQVTNFILLDEIHRRLILRSLDGNLNILDVDTLKLIFSIKQFQQPPLFADNTFIINQRIDPTIQSNVIMAPYDTIQNINLINPKRKFKSNGLNNYGFSIQFTKDFVISSLGVSQYFLITQKSNMQKVYQYPISGSIEIIGGCSNLIFTFPAQNNNFITACRQKILMHTFNTTSQAYYQSSSYPLKMTNLTTVARELTNHILVCYLTECYYHSKTSISTATLLFTDTSGFKSINAKSGQSFFTILTNSSIIYTFDYPSFTTLATVSLNSQCYQSINQGYLNSDSIIIACKPDSISLATIFHVATLTKTPTVSVTVKSLRIERVVTGFIFQSEQTVISYFVTGSKLYLYIYGFTPKFSEVFEKAQNILNFPSSTIKPTFDPIQRRLFLSSNTMLYSQSKFIGEIEDWSFQIQTTYYDELDSADKNFISKFKRCVYDQSIIGVVKQGSIFITDTLHNLQYKIYVQDVTDIYIDSSQNLVFYLVNNSFILYSYNYVQGQIVNQLISTVMMTDFTEFVNPSFMRTFIVNNKLTLDLSVCTYGNDYTDVSCFVYSLQQKSTDQIFTQIDGCQNILIAIDKDKRYYVFHVNPSLLMNQIMFVTSGSFEASVAKLMTKTCLLVVQVVNFRDGYVTDPNGLSQIQLKINCQILDIQRVDDGYFSICKRNIFKLTREFAVDYSISTNMDIKVAYYYQKRNIFLILSTQQPYYSVVSLYDLTTKLQLQSISVGINPLENIIYSEQEDIFLVYNNYGQLFRINLNKVDQEELIINVFQSNSGSQVNNYYPIVYQNTIINKLYFASQDTLYQWNYSPFIGERMGFKRIRYMQFNAQTNLSNPDRVYYVDLQGYIWEFYLSQQKLIGVVPSDIQDMYSTEKYLVVFCFSHIQIFQIDDLSNSLLISINITINIQMSIKMDSLIFAYIDSNLGLYILNLQKNFNTPPTLVGTFTGTPQDLIVLNNNTILISLIGIPPVRFTLSDNIIQPLSNFPPLKSLIGCQTIISDSSIILIEEQNIIKMDSTTFSLIKILNFPELDSAGHIESFSFDFNQNLFFIHYTLQSYVFIIPFTLVKTDIQKIGSCDTYKVKFLIQDFYIAIYCTFQVNFHQRNSDLTFMYSFRQPTIVNSMYKLFILNDKYLITQQQNNIQLFSISPVINGSRIFTLQRTLNSTNPQILQCILNDDNQIKISGVGYDGYFNNQIYMGNTCLNTLTSVKTMLGLKNQLNQINQAEENLLKYFYFNLQLDSQTVYNQIPFLDDLKFKSNNAQLTYIPQQSGQQLMLSNNIFTKTEIYDLVIKDFNFIIPDNTNNIVFNPNTQSIIFKRIEINQDLSNVSFRFLNLKKVVINQLVISDITVTNSVLFYVNGIDQFFFTDIQISNVRFINSTLLQVNNANSLIINTFKLDTIQLKIYEQKMLINILNTVQFTISGFTIIDIIGEDFVSIDDKISTDEEVIERDNAYLRIQLNHIFYLQKVSKIQFINGKCLYLKKVSLLKNENYYSDGLLLQTLEYSLVVLKSLYLQSNKAMNSVVYIQSSDIQIDSIVGNDNFCSDCNGAVIVVFQSKKLNINNSTFEANNAIHGGSFAHIDCLNQQNYITLSNFTKNSARGNGGAIYLEKCNLDIDHSILTMNSALIGGGIRYKEFVPIFIAKILNSTNNLQFIQNKGQIYGDKYGSYVGKISLENFQNSQQVGYYIPKNLTHKTYLIKSFSSGDSLEPKIKIYDEESSVISFNPKELGISKQIPNSIRFDFQKIILNLASYKDDILIEGPNFVTFQQFSVEENIFQFSKARIVSRPNFLGTLYIQTNVDFEIPQYILDSLTIEASSKRILQNYTTQNFQYIKKAQYSLSLQFLFRGCIRGEIYQNISDTKVSCLKCPYGTYSLEEPDFYKKQQCIQCSYMNTKECGNSTIVLQDGFWRSDVFSDVIVECSNRKDNCKDLPSSKNYCVPGLMGPLCEKCDVLGNVWGQLYSATLDYQCAPCTDYFSTYVRWILIFIGVNLYILGSYKIFCTIYRQKALVYYMRLASMICIGNSARRDESSTYLKFLINYAQLQSNINQFKYEIFILTIPTIFGKPITQLNTATDCQIVGYQNVLLVKATAMLLLPILFYLWICLIYLFLSIFQKKSMSYWYLSRMKLFSILLFSFTVFQPNIVSFLIQSLSCRKIGENRFVTSDLTVKCYNDQHIYVIIVSTIGLLLWVVLVPVYMYKQLSQIKNVEWITTQYKFGFLYLEFKKQNIHWELVRLYLKVFIVIYVNLLREYPITQFACIAFTLLGYYHLVSSRCPYQTNQMNQVDKNIIISLSIQVILNALIKDETEKYSLKEMVITLIIIAFNISTFVFLILTIMSQKIKFIRQNMNKIKFNLSKFQIFKKLNVFQNNLERQTNIKRFKLWRFLSNNLQSAIAECQRNKYNQLREIYLSKIQKEQISTSKKVENIFKDLDSLTQQRSSLSVVQPFRAMIKQNTRQQTEDINMSMDQITDTNINLVSQLTLNNNINQIKKNYSPTPFSSNIINNLNTADKLSPFKFLDQQGKFFNYNNDNGLLENSQLNLKHRQDSPLNKNSIEIMQQKKSNSKFSMIAKKGTIKSINSSNTNIKMHDEQDLQENSNENSSGSSPQMMIKNIFDLKKNSSFNLQNDLKDKQKVEQSGVKYQHSQIIPKIIRDEDASISQNMRFSQISKLSESLESQNYGIDAYNYHDSMISSVDVQSENPNNANSNVINQLNLHQLPSDILFRISQQSQSNK